MKRRLSKLQRQILEILKKTNSSSRLYRELLYTDNYENRRSLSASISRSLKTLKERGLITYEDRHISEWDGTIHRCRKRNIQLLKVNCTGDAQLTIRANEAGL